WFVQALFTQRLVGDAEGGHHPWVRSARSAQCWSHTLRGSRIDGRSPSLERQTYHAGALWKYVDLGCLADADAGVERYRGRMPCGVVGMLWGGVRVILVLHDS